MSQQFQHIPALLKAEEITAIEKLIVVRGDMNYGDKR